jgi:hypothetical protein
LLIFELARAGHNGDRSAHGVFSLSCRLLINMRWLAAFRRRHPGGIHE